MAPLPILRGPGHRVERLAVEFDDAVGRSARHVELHVGHAEPHLAKARARRVAADAIAPRAGRLDVVVMLLEAEAGSVQRLAHGGQAAHQRLPVRNDQPRVAAQHLRLAGRQVELAAADVDPHVADAGHQVGVARQAQAGHVKQRCELLVGHAGVDVLEGNDIADVLDAAVVLGQGFDPSEGCPSILEQSLLRREQAAMPRPLGAACRHFSAPSGRGLWARGFYSGGAASRRRADRRRRRKRRWVGAWLDPPRDLSKGECGHRGSRAARPSEQALEHVRDHGGLRRDRGADVVHLVADVVGHVAACFAMVGKHVGVCGGRVRVNPDRAYPRRFRAWHYPPCLGSRGGCRTWVSVSAYDAGVAVRSAWLGRPPGRRSAVVGSGSRRVGRLEPISLRNRSAGSERPLLFSLN